MEVKFIEKGTSIEVVHKLVSEPKIFAEWCIWVVFLWMTVETEMIGAAAEESKWMTRRNIPI